MIWSLICFLALAKYTLPIGYAQTLGQWEATRQAIAQVETSEAVLTTSKIAPHLTHRQELYVPYTTQAIENLDAYKYILLSLRHPGFATSPKVVEDAITAAQSSRKFSLRLEQDDVYLFIRNDE